MDSIFTTEVSNDQENSYYFTENVKVANTQLPLPFKWSKQFQGLQDGCCEAIKVSTESKMRSPEVALLKEWQVFFF